MSNALVANLVIPVVVSTITGIASSYIGVNVTLAIMETRINYIERDLNNVLKAEDDIQEIQLTLSTQSQKLERLAEGIQAIKTQINRQ